MSLSAGSQGNCERIPGEVVSLELGGVTQSKTLQLCKPSRQTNPKWMGWSPACPCFCLSGSFSSGELGHATRNPVFLAGQVAVNGSGKKPRGEIELVLWKAPPGARQ